MIPADRREGPDPDGTPLAEAARTTGTNTGGRPTVLLDTNALMMPVECDVRLFDELDRVLGSAPKLLVPAPVVEELESLAERGGQEGRAAAVGLDLADRATLVDTDAGYADDAVVELATDPAGGVGYVVTNDRSLQERLTQQDVHVIGLRGRNTLAVTTSPEEPS